jgi:hypothetical protein
MRIKGLHPLFAVFFHSGSRVSSSASGSSDEEDMIVMPCGQGNQGPFVSAQSKMEGFHELADFVPEGHGCSGILRNGGDQFCCLSLSFLVQCSGSGDFRFIAVSHNQILS